MSEPSDSQFWKRSSSHPLYRIFYRSKTSAPFFSRMKFGDFFDFCVSRGWEDNGVPMRVRCINRPGHNSWDFKTSQIRPGESSTHEYCRWEEVVGRCHDTNHADYKNYGLRGVYISEDWLHFNRFRDWLIANKVKPGDHLHRIHNHGPYAPWNCELLSTSKHGEKHRLPKDDYSHSAESTRLKMANAAVRRWAKSKGRPMQLFLFPVGASN